MSKDTVTAWVGENKAPKLEALAFRAGITLSSLVSKACDALLAENPIMKRDINKFRTAQGKPLRLNIKGVKLSDRAKEAVKLRNKGLTYEAIGEQLGVSKQRAHEMVSGAIE